MTRFLKDYGDTEGPLGFPMRDTDAKALDALLEAHPEYEYARAVVHKATAELLPGERADLSWIHTEALDRHKDVVLLSGFDDSLYKLNPVVTLNHDYTREPVGKSAWRRKVREDGTRGVKAKTVYPDRPAEWTGDRPWPADAAFALVKAGLMAGKSVGFLTLEAHAPTDEEVKKNPEWEKAYRVVTKWALIEYSCTWLPVNPECVVEAVAKSLITPGQLAELGIDVPRPAPAAPAVPFRTESEVRKSVATAIDSLNIDQMAQERLAAAYDRARGRV